MVDVHELSLLLGVEEAQVRNWIADFWSDSEQFERLSGTLRGEIREHEIRVTELLEARRECDTHEAWRITVQIACLLDRVSR